MPRKTAFIGFSYFGGLLLASFISLWLSVTIGGLFLCAGLCILLFIRPEKTGTLFRMGVCAASAAAGLFLYSGYDAFVCTPLSAYDGYRFTSEAVITDSRVYSSGNAFYEAKCILPDGRKFRTGFYDSRTDLITGDSLTLTGTLYLPENTDFFNAKDYYNSRGILLLTEREASSDYIIGENSFFHAIDKFRSGVIRTIRDLQMGESGELVIGMTFGSRYWNMPEENEDMLYRSGIGHVTAVSGMHMAIAAAIVSCLANILGLGAAARGALTVSAAAIFAAAAGMSDSVIRSFIMITIVCLSEIMIRKGDSLTSLAAAIIIITLFSPYAVRSTSFLLSVSGVFGTSVLAPGITDAAEKALLERFGMKTPFTSSLISSAITVLCAWAAVYPVSVLVFDEISAISPVTNLLLSPICSLAVGMSITGLVLTLLPVPFFSRVIFTASGLLCRLILDAASLAGKVPEAAVPTGLDVTVPMLIISALICAVSAAVLNDRFYTAVTFLACSFICLLTSAVYCLIPSDNTEIAVLTEGSGCVIIVKDEECSQIYDFTGSTKGIRAAKRYIRRRGAPDAALVVLYESSSGVDEYSKNNFPDAQIVSLSSSDSLTYCEENNIIKFGDHFLYNYGRYAVLSCKGEEIICINGKSSPEDKKYDLAVYNCRADVCVESDLSIVTRKSYGGEFSPSDEYVSCTGCEYILTDSGIAVKEELTWLR